MILMSVNLDNMDARTSVATQMVLSSVAAQMGWPYQTINATVKTLTSVKKGTMFVVRCNAWTHTAVTNVIAPMVKTNMLMDSVGTRMFVVSTTVVVHMIATLTLVEQYAPVLKAWT
jgi:hypothetical protein